ncbi:MAG: hypothetical protein PVI86_07180 [Phycisphaerae bacterium]|jgi:hypothetical protein
MLRSIVSIVAGFVVWSVLWLVAGQVALGVAPAAFGENGATSHGGVLGGLLVASVICSLIGGLTVALIVRRSVTGHAVVLGVVLLAVGVAVQAQSWDAMPVWYHLLFLVLLLPLTVVGAQLRPAVMSAGAPAGRPAAG